MVTVGIRAITVKWLKALVIMEPWLIKRVRIISKITLNIRQDLKFRNDQIRFQNKKIKEIKILRNYFEKVQSLKILKEFDKI
jgi:hypothetical protein